MVAGSTPLTRAASTLAAVTERIRKTPRGTIGYAARRSTSTNTANAATASSPTPSVCGAAQPCSSARITADTSAAVPVVTAIEPGRSSRPRVSRRPCPVITQAAAAIRIAPSGTLTKNTQRQLSSPVRTPPRMPPNAPPAAAAAVSTLSAFARAFWSATPAVTRVSVVGTSTAAPAPWTNRAAISCQPAWAKPQARLASENSSRPARKARLCPHRSPTRPPSSRNPANVSV